MHKKSLWFINLEKCIKLSPIVKKRHGMEDRNMQWNILWYDNWIEDQNLVQLLSIDEDSIPNPTAKESNFIQNGQWDLFKLNLTLQHHQIIQKIVGIALPITKIEDSFCWGLNRSGSFSAKSATWLAHGKRVSEQQPWEFKWIWNIETMPKIKVFLWQMYHISLPVRGTLSRWGC